jgi:hypothetical protein
VRSGRWKIYFPHEYITLAGKPGGKDGKPVPYQKATIGLALYDLDKDLGETTNVIHQHPDVVRCLETLADQMRADLGDSLTGKKGKGVRPAAE